MSVNYPAMNPYGVMPQRPAVSIAPGPEQENYREALDQFGHGYHDFFGDQYGQNANHGLEALTKALRQEMSQIKTQLAQNQAQLAQIQYRLNFTA